MATQKEVTEKELDAALEQVPQEEVAPVIVSKKEKAPEQVTLSTEAFNALMKRLEDLEGTQKQMFVVQDKDKIAKIEAMRRSGKLIKSVNVRKYMGQYILGWDKMIQNDVYKDEQGRRIEKQTVSFWFEDDTKHEMAYREWGMSPEMVPFEVTKESKDAEGNIFLTLVGADGKTLEINQNFIN